LEEKVSDLRDKMEKIGAIVEMIEGFAETTNVLAINAFIQAARAGEKGKGFSVVAGAVRGLAENSRKAATDIQTIVEAARDSMEEARISVASGNETVGNNFALASLARDALASVHESSQSAEAAIHAIDGRLKSIESTGREVRDAMSKLREIIEGNGLQVSEISLSTEEMSVQEGELSRTASELLSMARDQEILLTQLTIEREG
jgi:methyl-accepting chemotaxis protein